MEPIDKIRKIREFFSGDQYATLSTGAVIEEAGKNYAKCSLKLERKHRNAMGGVMGGAMFTLADFAFAVASNIGSPPTVSVSGQIVYLGAVKGDVLTAVARCLHAGRSGCSFTVDISDNLGNAVASVTFYGFRMSGSMLIDENGDTPKNG